MKKYLKPEIELIRFSTETIATLDDPSGDGVDDI